MALLIIDSATCATSSATVNSLAIQLKGKNDSDEAEKKFDNIQEFHRIFYQTIK